MSKEPNVKSFQSTDAQGRPVRFTVSTDIVDYIASARPFGREDLAAAGAHGRFQKRVVAIPDRSGAVTAPMMLSIGNTNALHLVRKQEGAESWQRLNLSAAFEAFGVKNAQVRAMGAAWTDDDRIAIAVAVDDGTANAPSRVFVAYDLSSRTDWSQIPWQDCGTREQIRVYGIRVLAENDGGWTVVLNGDIGRVDMLYLLRSKRPGGFAQALVFNPPVDYQEILDFEVMVDKISGSGIAILGKSGDSRVLSVRLFPEYDAQGRPSNSVVMALPCPAGATVLESGVTRDGGTDLYIGGSGVHLIPADAFYDQEEAKVIQVMSPDAAPHVEELAVADGPGGGAAIWARRQEGLLVVAVRAMGAPEDQWSTPLRLRDGVQTIAPVPGGGLVTASLFVVYTEGRAGFLFRDAATGSWRESPLLTASSEDAVKATCFGTAVRLLDDGGFPQVGVKVKVSASALTNVCLNGHNVFIGPGLEIERETDANGAVQLYDRVRSLTPAVYRFAFAGVPGAVDVNPAGGIYDRFSHATAAELRENPELLPGEFRGGGARAGEIDGMAAALRQAASLAKATSSGATPSAVRTQAGASFSSQLRAGAVDKGYQWGIRTGAGGVATIDDSAIDVLLKAAQPVAQFFSDLGDSLADLFEGAKNRLREAWTFIVRKAGEAFEFVCALGNQIRKFVLRTLEEIGSFFTWLWSEVKTGLEKVWDFLKFVFNWEDILLARDVLVSATNESLVYLKRSAATLKDNANLGFEFISRQIDQWRVDIGMKPSHLPKPGEGSSFTAKAKQSNDGAQQKVDQSTGNSVIGWIFDQLNSIFDQIVKVEGADPSQIAIQAGANFITGLANDQFDNLLRTWDQIQQDIQKIFNNDLPGASELSLETIRNLFIAVGSDVLIGLLQSLRSLVVRAIDLLGELVDAARAALFARIRFPFIEKLVELVAPGTKVDASFRLVDALMLLVAVPATITYKLIFGKAPFERGDSAEFPFGHVVVGQRAELQPRPPRAVAMSMGASADVPPVVVLADEIVDDMKRMAALVADLYKKTKNMVAEDVLPPLKQWAEGMAPFLRIGAAFAKTAAAVYFTAQALKGGFGGSNKGIIAGVAFSALGVAVQFWTIRPGEGTVVQVLDAVGTCLSGLSLVTSIAAGFGKWNNPIGDTIGLSHKIEAVVDACTTGIQVVTGVIIFGFIADAVGRSGKPAVKHRILPETFSWVAGFTGSAGSILTSAAVIAPVAAVPARLFLLGAGAIGRGASTAFTILEVVATKVILERATA